MDRILADFERQVIPHVTHWNHPGFMGYFATSGSMPGVLAEALIAGLNNIGLLWKTSPALTELEQVTMGWLTEWLDLPRSWFGMTLAGASVASLHAVIGAREAAREQARATGRSFDLDKLTLYTSEQAHSSIEKTMLVLGLPRDNCRKVGVDEEFRMRPDLLEDLIQADLAGGLQPFCIAGTVGPTSTTSVDPIATLADIAEHHSLSLVPAYLRSQQDERAVNFMEYALPLGCRFRALKLWFVMRYFGREGSMANLREHIRLANDFAKWVDDHPDFERLATAPFSVVCFRYKPAGADAGQLNAINQRLIKAINATGEFFLSSTAAGSTGQRNTHVKSFTWSIRTPRGTSGLPVIRSPNRNHVTSCTSTGSRGRRCILIVTLLVS